MKTKSLTGMNISIPSALRERLEEKLSRQAYGSVSEYVRQLIRQDLERDAREKVEALLLEGVQNPNSGRIAVKVINHLGDEAMKVFRL